MDNRQKSSGAEGERLKEATNINKSLSTLGCAVLTFKTFFVLLMNETYNYFGDFNILY